MRNFTSTLLTQRDLAQGYKEMTFSWPADAEAPLPGQFLTLKITDNPAPLLRRPFALSGFDRQGGCASIIYQIRGPATRAAAQLETGASLEVLSPLGNSFPLPREDETPLLAAGGIGLGPILYLAAHLDALGFAPRLVFGCRSRALLPALGELTNGSIHYCTDDGSAGFPGSAVDFLRTLDGEALPSPRLYACGPWGMLKGCHDFAREREMPCFAAMEQMMACGVGACMGCVIETVGEKPYARVCKEGPVFDARIIKWT